MDDLEHAEVLHRLRIHESSLAHKSETIENRLRMLQQARQHKFAALHDGQVRAPLATVMPLSSLLKFQMDSRRDHDGRVATPSDPTVGTVSDFQSVVDGARLSDAKVSDAGRAGGIERVSQNLPRSGAASCSLDSGDGGRKLSTRGPRCDTRGGRRLRLAPTSRVGARSSSPKPATRLPSTEITDQPENVVRPPEDSPQIDDPVLPSSWFSMPWHKHRSQANRTESGAGTAVRTDCSHLPGANPGSGHTAQLWTPRSSAPQSVSPSGIASPTCGHEAYQGARPDVGQLSHAQRTAPSPTRGQEGCPPVLLVSVVTLGARDSHKQSTARPAVLQRPRPPQAADLSYIWTWPQPGRRPLLAGLLMPTTRLLRPL
mmetsp:Transcript_14755/g.32760  ORF Transcript_14755/g.32760 Transcript_14755/m.32760 type:complete len:372 (+) Transcript_14755:59-1174(+)